MRWADSIVADLKRAKVPLSRWVKKAEDKQGWREMRLERGEAPYPALGRRTSRNYRLAFLFMNPHGKASGVRAQMPKPRSARKRRRGARADGPTGAALRVVRAPQALWVREVWGAFFYKQGWREMRLERGEAPYPALGKRKSRNYPLAFLFVNSHGKASGVRAQRP